MHSLDVQQTIHRKRKKPKLSALASFRNQIDFEPLPPIVNTIQLKTSKIWSSTVLSNDGKDTRSLKLDGIDNRR